MIKNLIFFFSVGLFFSSSVSGQTEVEKLRQNVVNYLLKDDPQGEKTSAPAMNPEGYWSDVMYKDQIRGSWKAAVHLSRTLEMAVAYNTPGNPKYHNPGLLADIRKAIRFWVKNDFQNPNWWYTEINTPKQLSSIVLLMQKHLSKAEIDSSLVLMKRSRIGRTGQNKVWLAGNVLFYSIITNDTMFIRKASDAIQEEVQVTEQEGIQPDFSFHQHGPQQQFGNYGQAFASDITKWALILNGTPFAFEPGKIEILRNYLLKGMRWVMWNNYLDVSACGRQFVPNTQAKKARSISNVFKKIKNADPEYAAAYNNALINFPGNKHFWRSDMTVHRRPNYYASVKMCSRRVSGAETVNSENIQGYHMGDGVLMVYRKGNEFEDIFPVWDWKRVPGITCFQDKAPLPQLTSGGYHINSDFVGGVSDENDGVAAFHYIRDSLNAFKSYFFMDDIIVCLGAGISTLRKDPVATSVNQCLLKGNVVAHQNNKMVTLNEGSHLMNEAKWILHDSIGYYFPGKVNINIENTVKEGAWNRVTAPTPYRKVSSKVFSLWIDHGIAPQDAGYVYYVVPNASVNTMNNIQKTVTVNVNTSSVQSVSYKNIEGIIFYSPSSCNFKNKLMVSANQACVVLFSQKDGKQQISVSDPTHFLKAIKLSINGKYSANAVNSTFDQAANLTIFEISLPQGPEAGKSVSFIIN